MLQAGGKISDRPVLTKLAACATEQNLVAQELALRPPFVEMLRWSFFKWCCISVRVTLRQCHYYNQRYSREGKLIGSEHRYTDTLVILSL